MRKRKIRLWFQFLPIYAGIFRDNYATFDRDEGYVAKWEFHLFLIGFLFDRPRYLIGGMWGPKFIAIDIFFLKFLYNRHKKVLRFDETEIYFRQEENDHS